MSTDESPEVAEPEFDRGGYRPASGMPASGMPARGGFGRPDFTPGPGGTGVAAAEAQRLIAKTRREAFNEGYAQAHAAFAPKLVELEQLLITRSLAKDASDADRRMGLAATRQVIERLGGKPSQHIETSDGDSDAKALARLLEARRQQIGAGNDRAEPDALIDAEGEEVADADD